jgi:glycosyltransferase involved in cell wall biosynthesis
MRKPLLIRPMNTWSERRLLWRLERALLERIAGGRNVVFATGTSDKPASSRNAAIRWIFSSTVSEAELDATSAARHLVPGRTRLIIVGRQLETEGTAAVLHALPALTREFPHITLDVVGHGADLSNLERLATELHLLDRVTFHGAATHERVLELLRQADVFCLPTIETESLRQSVHEALACGLPVVTTSTSLDEMIDGCGVILQSLTRDALANGVKSCLRDPAAYQRMSAQALRSARNYSLERWCDTIGEAVKDAWGPLQSEPVETGRMKAVQEC